MWNEFYAANESKIQTKILEVLDEKGISVNVLSKHKTVWDVAARMVVPFNQTVRESKDSPRLEWDVFEEVLEGITEAMVTRQREDRALWARPDGGRDAR